VAAGQERELVALQLAEAQQKAALTEQ
jgi:hypothetical protein